MSKITEQKTNIDEEMACMWKAYQQRKYENKTIRNVLFLNNLFLKCNAAPIHSSIHQVIYMLLKHIQSFTWNG